MKNVHIQTYSPLKHGRDTLRRHSFDRSERYPKLYALLETRADRKTYRGFATASTNIFCHWQKMIQLQTPSTQIKAPPNRVVLLFGGEGGIRTLEPLLMVTRFPIVRARPTTRLLRIGRRPLYNDFGKKSSIFLIFFISFL